MIGAGHMGTLHARNLMADARVHIVGVTDVVPDRAEALARLCQGQSFSNVEALLEASIEAVYVCTPNALHTEAVLASLQRHVHVFSEKPMATTLREARQIIEATRTSRACYQVGHNRRFARSTLCQATNSGWFCTDFGQYQDESGELKNPPWVGDTSITGFPL
jgi:myo-inositol 2-dehydrogenase/D-chiro-inositol 1-dehydrogenase